MGSSPTRPTKWPTPGHFLLMDTMNKTSSLPALVAENLRPYLLPTDRLLLGVSGGADSLALLHILHGLLAPNQLIVAHLNHNLRPEAAAEADFVQQTAVAWHRPFFQQTTDIVQLSQQHGWSIEEAARHARYRFFAHLAQTHQCRFVAVAHHADDQAETILLHLLRGTGLAGLQGMQTAAPLPGQPELTLLRPLLTASRQQIETYCAAHQLQPQTDASNQDPRFLRNRIRHQLLPLLNEYNPQIKTHLQQLADISQADYAWLHNQFTAVWPSLQPVQGTGWLQFDRAAWQQQPLSFRRWALRYAMQQPRPWLTDISFRLLEAARTLAETGSPGSQLHLPAGLQLHVSYHHLTIAEAAAQLPRPSGPQLLTTQPVSLLIPGQLALADGWVLQATFFAGETAVVGQNSDPWQAVVYVGQAKQLTVRPRLPGDRLQPLGLNGRHTSLKELMIDRKIPQPLRPLWPIVWADEQIVWVVGQQIDHRAQVSHGREPLVWLRCLAKG